MRSNIIDIKVLTYIDINLLYTLCDIRCKPPFKLLFFLLQFSSLYHHIPLRENNNHVHFIRI